MGKSEENQKWMALQILIADDLPILIRELERSADVGDLLRRRCRQSVEEYDDCAEEPKPGKECRAYHQDADAARSHNEVLGRQAFRNRRPSLQRSSRRRLPCRNVPTAPQYPQAGGWLLQ